MKITFLNMRKDMYPPLGLCYLSSFLKTKIPGINILLIERIFGESEKVVSARILDSEPDVVGLTTYTVGYHQVISLCEYLKKLRPGLKIWLGGPHITSLPQTLPMHADIGVIGEGELTILELCHKTDPAGQIIEDALQGIKGICFRKNGQLFTTPRRDLITPLDSIPPPDVSMLNMEWYTKPKRFFIMERYLKGFVLLTSRGCPYDCRFCQAAVQWGKCRYHSAERVVSEIETQRKNNPNINAINIIDDLFIGSRKRLREIVRLLREKMLHDGIVFNVNGRANLIDSEVIKLLKSINVIQISYGFETGSERILSFLKKGSVSVHHNENAANLTNSYGIGVGGQFMIGTPGETREDIGQTIDFIKNHQMSHAHLSVTCPLPGTDLWEICSRKGLVSENMDWRKLDFGNPDNPNLIYVNADIIPKDEFNLLLKEAHAACSRWNPKFTLRDYFYFREILSPREFMRKTIAKIMSIISNIIKNWLRLPHE